MAKSGDMLTIGETANRCGIAASALRFYESRGLIRSQRGRGNQRRYHRSEIRKISIIRVAQNLGLTLKEIEHALSSLPDKRTPNKKDWEQLSNIWRSELDRRINSLEQLRDQLTGCIGCGCLSMKKCALYNKNDNANSGGTGPRFLLGDFSGKSTGNRLCNE